MGFSFIHWVQLRVCTRELIILEALAEGLSYKMVAKKNISIGGWSALSYP